jgi:hypothetical protein
VTDDDYRTSHTDATEDDAAEDIAAFTGRRPVRALAG